MVSKNVLDKITLAVRTLIREHALNKMSAVKAEQVYDNECVVKISEDDARLYDDELGIICGQLKDAVPEILKIYDCGKGMYRTDGYRAYEITVADGNWSHTKEDEDAIEEDMRQYFDEDYIAEQEKKRQKEREKHWREHLLPIPKAPKGASDEVFLIMAYEPYDQVKDGSKKHEFRAYTERYVAKLLSRPIRRVKFQRGYGGPGRPKPEQMVYEAKGVSLYDIQSGKMTDPFNPEPIVPTHLVIDLGRRIS